MTIDRRRLLTMLLVLVALPGLFLLIADIFRPSRDAVVERSTDWRALVAGAADRFAVEPTLILAVIAVESKGDERAEGNAGERGLMQLMPETAREQAVRLRVGDIEDLDLFDPATNILLGASYLAEQLNRFGEDPVLALAAYNAGPGRVRGWLDASPGVKSAELIERSAFPSTRAYVRNVLAYRDLIAARLAGGGKRDAGPADR